MAANSKKAVENRLLDMYFAVLKDRLHFTQRTQPLGYGADILKKLSRWVREQKGIVVDKNIPLYAMSPSFQLDVKARYKFGGTGLGAYALANVHHILGQYAGLSLNTNLGIGNTVGVEDMTAVKLSSVIYGKLGTITKSRNIDIRSWFELKEAKSPIYAYGDIVTHIISTRITNSDQHFGNPFSSDAQVLAKNPILIKTNSTRESVEKYIDWVINASDYRAIWIRQQLDSGKLIDRPILYYKELGEPSHATALDYLINNWENIKTGNIGGNKLQISSLSEKYGQDGELITEWFSALIDAHVDIAADPFIYYLNVNGYSRDVVTLLLRAGVGGVNTHLFAAQPILEEIASKMENRDNKLGIRLGNVAYNKLQEYKKAYKSITNKEVVDLDVESNLKSIFDTESLKSNISGKNRTAEWYENQIHVLQAFEHVSKFAASLTQATLSSRIDTKKFGNNISEISAYMTKLESSLGKSSTPYGIRNFDKLMEESYLGPLTDNSIGTIKETLANLIIEATPAFQGAVSQMLTLTGTENPSASFINTLADELYVSINSDFFYNKLGLSKDYIGSLVTGDNTVAKQLQDIKTSSKFTDINKNILIESLSPIFEQDKPDFIKIIKPDDKWQKDNLVSAWRDLMLDEREGVRKFANDLVYYSFVTSGFKNTIFSFFDLIPREVLKDIGYNDYIRDVRSHALIYPSHFNGMVNETIKNAWYNKEIVPKLEDVDIDTKYGSNSYVITTNNAGLLIGENTNSELVFKPYVTSKGSLYRYVGYTRENKAIYAITDKSSYYDKGNVIRENFLGETLAKSVNIPTLSDSVKSYIYNDRFAEMVNLTDKSGNYIFDKLRGATFVSSETQLDEAPRFNPLKGVNTDTLTTLEASEGIVKLNETVQSGFYTLPNDMIVYIDNKGDNDYIVTKYYNRTPTLQEVDERLKQCE